MQIHQILGERARYPYLCLPLTLVKKRLKRFGIASELIPCPVLFTRMMTESYSLSLPLYHSLNNDMNAPALKIIFKGVGQEIINDLIEFVRIKPSIN